MEIKVSDLKKEKSLDTSNIKDKYIDKIIVDELVFQTWGWANKLNIKKLKYNKKLKERVDNNDLKLVIKIEEKDIKIILKIYLKLYN